MNIVRGHYATIPCTLMPQTVPALLKNSGKVKDVKLKRSIISPNLKKCNVRKCEFIIWTTKLLNNRKHEKRTKE